MGNDIYKSKAISDMVGAPRCHYCEERMSEVKSVPGTDVKLCWRCWNRFVASGALNKPVQPPENKPDK